MATPRGADGSEGEGGIGAVNGSAKMSARVRSGRTSRIVIVCESGVVTPEIVEPPEPEEYASNPSISRR